MKKMNIKNLLFLTLLLPSLQLLGQRTFIGANFGTGSIGGYTSNGYTVNNTAYPGTVKSSLTTLGITFSRYSSVRRGYNLFFNPMNTLTNKFTSDDNSVKATDKLHGMSFGIGFFGLIATDYQSKLEVHMCNRFMLDLYSEAGFVDDYGFALRYRINRKLKAALDCYILHNLLDGYSNFVYPQFGVHVLYAP